MLSSAVIVGGSLSGLLHGLHLKRMGIDVTILEQDASSERSSHNAGIQVSNNVQELLGLHDATGRHMTVQATANQWSIHPRKNVFQGAGLRYWTNWGLLYRVLRANFDGYQSKACPEAPESRPRDGNALYLTGNRVTGLQYKEGLVTVYYVDQAGTEASLTTELLIGADGSRSTVRRLVQAPSAVAERYTGYFAWRGAVPRRLVSKDTAEYFDNNVSLEFMGSKTYIICYVIPTDNGGFDPDELLLNWLIYEDLTEGSAEETALLTDVNGRRHQNTVPQGLTNPAIWEQHRDELVTRLIPPFAEIVTKSPTPFITKIQESLGSQASFHDGHVVLVGDALATYRPNIGRATDQAASHALLLGQVLRGEKTTAAWNVEVCADAKRVFLLARVMSELCRGTWFSFFKAMHGYYWYLLKIKIWKPRV